MIDKIEKISSNTRNLVNQFFLDNWFSTDMSIRGKIIDCTKVDGFLLQEDNIIIGLVTYTFFGDICEIVSLDSKKENIGIGSALLEEIVKVAINYKCKKMRLITTNDNMRALQFYQKRGYCLTKLYPNAMEEVRKVKPDVPILGDNDIPLRDEIELEKMGLEKGSIIMSSMMLLGVGAGLLLPVGIYNCTKSTDNINWASLKKSSIVTTQDGKMTNYHIVSNNENNKYHDIINNYDINPDTIVYNIDTTSYLANINNVKGIYSKEELSVILKDFSMNQEYTVSDQTAKVLVKQK